MSNNALNAHIAFGEPCGEDADLATIADWAGSMLLDSQRTLLNIIYAQAYSVGHQDTVEGNYTQILPEDYATYFNDEITKLLREVVKMGLYK